MFSFFFLDKAGERMEHGNRWSCPIGKKRARRQRRGRREEIMGDEIRERKAREREEVAELRRGLSEEYCRSADAEISSRILQHPYFQQADTIFCYISVEKEPDTKLLLESAWQMGKRVSVPRCIPGRERRMEAVEIRSFQDLGAGVLGIPEPKPGLPPVEKEEIDLALIPCISADRSGRRLGHGAGYYDRFLEGQRMHRFCLCYEKLLLDKISVDNHDILMERVFSEDGVYPYFSAKGEDKQVENSGSFLSKLRRFFHRI